MIQQFGLPELEKVLEPLDGDARNTIMLEVQNAFKFPPPIVRETVTGDSGGFTFNWNLTNYYNVNLDISKIDRMMRSGQIAYPMTLKKAPAISIINSASGFKVQSPDEDLASMIHANLRDLLPRIIDEILTFQEYGAYYGEVTWEPAYPQDYGLTKSDTPYWIISDFNGCHPTTIKRVLRNERTRSFEGFEQEVTWLSDTIKVGLDRALVIPNNGTFGNVEGQSILEQVYVWWYWYELIWRALLRYLQRVGDGVVVVRAPSRGKVMVNNKSIDAMDWGMQLAASMRKTNSGVMPSDLHREANVPLWNVELVKTGDEAAGRHFTDALTMLSDNINRYLLTGDPAGSGDEFTVMLDTERMLGHIAMHINRYVLRRALKYNNSDAMRLYMEFQGANSRVLPLLFKLMAVAGNTAGDALKNVNWRELFTKGGIPVLEEEEVEKLKAEGERKAMEIAQGKFGQSQGAKGGGDEDAKGQPGGEGRWASQRDKEGKTEKLEAGELEFAEYVLDQARAVAGEMGTPAVHLSVDQVSTLYDMGLLADDQPITLFNPYHDEGGRFTSKERATTPASGVNNKLRSKISISKKHKDVAIIAVSTAIAATWILYWSQRFKRQEEANEEEFNSIMDEIRDYISTMGPFKSGTIDDIIDEVNDDWPELDSIDGAEFEGVVRDFYNSSANILVFAGGGEQIPGSGMVGDRPFIDRTAAKMYIDLFNTVADIELERGEGHVDLFNPYHDEGGRFTSEAKAVVPGIASAADDLVGKIRVKYDAAEDWVREHKKEVALVAGALAAAGVTALIITKMRDSSVATVEGAWGGTINVMGNFSAKSTALIQSRIALAANAVQSLGIDIGTENITAYKRDDDYYKFSGTREEQATAFVDNENNAHIGPFLTGLLESGEYGNAGPQLVAHELIHTRKGASEAFKRFWGAKPIEEGLTGIGDCMSRLMIEFGHINLKDERQQGYLDHLFKHHPYKEDVSQIYYIAQAISQKTGKPWQDIFFGWIQGDANDAYADIYGMAQFLDVDLYGKYGVSIGDLEKQDADSVELSNPYHDAAGQFTTREKAIAPRIRDAAESVVDDVKDAVKQIGKDIAVQYDETVEWANEHKKELAAFAGVLAAAGVTAVAVSAYKNRSMFDVDGSWKGRVTIVGVNDWTALDPTKWGDWTPADVVRVQAKVAAAASAVGKQGIDARVHEIRAYTNDEDYRKSGAISGMARAFVAKKKPTEVNLSPSITRSLSKSREWDEAQGIVAHEVIHTRPHPKTNSFAKHSIEEGLAGAGESLSRVLLKFGNIDPKSREHTSLFEEAMGQSIYRKDIQRLYYIAISQSIKTGKPWNEIFYGWLNNTNYNEILSLIKEFPMPKHLDTDSDHDVELLNPFHDIRGRFTTREKAIAPKRSFRQDALPMPEGTYEGKKVSEKDVKKGEKLVDKAYELAGVKPVPTTVHGSEWQYAKDVCGKNVICHLQIRNTYAVTVWDKDGNKAVHIGPKCVKLIKRHPDFVQYVITHEVYHVRDKANGKLPFDGRKTYEGMYAELFIEEGCTDILARAANNKGAEYWLGGRSPAYMPYMGAIAKLAWGVAGGNKALAMQIIDEIHLHSNDFDYMAQVFTKYTGQIPDRGWNENNIFGMMLWLQDSAQSQGYQELIWLLGR